MEQFQKLNFARSQRCLGEDQRMSNEYLMLHGKQWMKKENFRLEKSKPNRKVMNATTDLTAYQGKDKVKKLCKMV